MVIGLICGCFDMFHIGHLNILKRCKENCDYLIVGVCDDNHIRIKKHKEPIISENDRLAIVSSIKYVDKAFLITHNETEKKMPIIKANNVNIVFDGDDWKDDERYKKLKQAGIEVKFFPYTQGISTTYLREKIKDQ